MIGINRTTKLRWRRHFRSRRRQVEDIGFQAEEQIEKHFFKRLARLFDVRRFVIGWIALLVLLGSGVTMQLRTLNSYYQELRPVAGGTYTEGMIGTFTNASPLYATGLVDTTVSRLVFAGLLKYDANNVLVGDLAEAWTVDADGKVYTATLRSGLKWHDGTALTAEDVAFTFRTIQNPDAKSPLFRAWQGVSIKVVDERTVTFTLASSLAPFVYGLTTGIVPRHNLEDIPPAQLRSSPFNTSRPVGAGPFTWETIEIIANGIDPNRQQIGLKAFNGYHHGSPKLGRFVIKTYTDEAQLINSFKKQEVNGLVGLDRLPEALADSENVLEYAVPLTAETAVFLRTESELLKDARVRQALVQAVNVPAVVGGLGYPAIIADEPLLKGQLGYSAVFRQLTVNIEAANKLLDDAGWKLPPGEAVRTNGATKLSLKFYAQNTTDYAYLTEKIQKNWQAIGVEAQVTLPGSEDMQNIINSRDYDAVLYGISIGADPDVFAYWHSTQADPRSPSRLNLSDYKSDPADKSLEAGRNRIDPALRAAKYIPFLQSWRMDAPAIMLYQPRFLYITRGQLFGFGPKTINTTADRLNNVQGWMIRQDRMPKS